MSRSAKRACSTTFLAQLDALLPDDALLIAEWALIRRSLFAMDEVRDDELALRDFRTADRMRVTNTNASDASPPGDLMLGRPPRPTSSPRRA